MNGNLQNIYDIIRNPYQPGAYQICRCSRHYLKNGLLKPARKGRKARSAGLSNFFFAAFARQSIQLKDDLLMRYGTL